MPESQPHPLAVSVWLPTDPPRPAPPVLTTEEVCLLLRIRSEKPENTLRRYREAGKLRGMMMGKFVVYTLEAVMQFIKTQSEEVPR